MKIANYSPVAAKSFANRWWMFVGVLAVWLSWWVTLVYAQVSASLEFGEPTSVVANQEVSVPILLNTAGQEVDGLQLAGTLEGVAVANVGVVLDGAAKLQLVRQENEANKFAAIMLSQSPGQPLIFSTATVVAHLVFTPLADGEISITLDQTNSLVPSHLSAQNILGPVSSKSITIGQSTTALEATQDEMAEANNETATGTASRMLLGIVIAIVAIAAAFGVRWYRNRAVVATIASTPNLAPAPNPTTAVTNSASVTTPPPVMASYPTMTAQAVPPAPTFPVSPINTNQ